jgi:hypothetical protein
MSEYGLPGLRDKDGELQAVEHTYEWGGEEITIKLRPPTISEQDDYAELGEEASNEELRGILDDHLVKPEIPEDQELTGRELLAYVEGIVDFSQGGGNDVAQAVQEELEQRAEGSAGN